MSNTSLLGSYGGQGDSSLMFRNVLINGNFDIWQRGTSAANSGASPNLGSYPSADRWKFLTHTANVGWVDGTLTQSTDTPSTDIKYSVKVVSTSAALDDVVVFQTVEAVNAQSLAGKSATLSFWCKKGAGLVNAKTFKYVVRHLNTTDVGTNAPLHMDLTTLIQEATISSTSLSSSWTKISMTIPVMPSQTANGVVVEFRLDDDNLGSGDLLFLSQVQLEAGSVATPFERRPIGTELALCQRYYWRESAGAGNAAYKALLNPLTTTRFLGAPFNLPASLRATSGSGQLSVSFANVKIWSYTLSASVAVTSITIYSCGANSTAPTLDIACNAVGSGTSQPYLLALDADTGFIAISAEL